MTEPYFSNDRTTLYLGDALSVAAELPSESVNCIVTSPPYFGLRDYGTPGQYGLESSPADYVENMRKLFGELRRVLTVDGTLWLNIGDSYSTGEGKRQQKQPQTNTTTVNGALVRMPRGATPSDHRASSYGHVSAVPPAKNLLGIPWRVAFALQDDGWILRNDIIWHKPNAMPESVRDRLSTRYEHVFLFSKSSKYWFDLDPIREPHKYPDDQRKLPRAERGQTSAPDHQRGGLHPKGRNPGDVWAITTKPFPEAHFAVYPPELPERCILAGCKPGGVVLDPFSGSGTTGLAALRHERSYVGIELNKEYLDLSITSKKRLAGCLTPHFDYEEIP